jgi:P4 family phage/plasmid primase-like protien
VQLFVKIPYPILDDDYFEATRPHYAELCRKIQLKLAELGVSGEIDTSVFSAARLLRFPNTLNRKPGKPERMAKIIQPLMEVQEFYIEQLSGLDIMQKPDQIKLDVIKKYPEPDANAVMDGCLFMKHCKENPAKVSEPQWYALASIAPRLYKDEDKGKKLFHELSEGHPNYSFYEAETKAEQGLRNAGPRTCKNIDSLWDGCKNCPHHGTELVSPILIHGPDYIKSKDFGFREIKSDKNGNLVSGRPEYDDLIKQFEKEHRFVSILEENAIYTFIDTHWREFLATELKSWAAEKIDPSPSGAEMKEFCERIRAKNPVNQDWFFSSTDGKMNFKNGVLDLESMELLPHNPEYGFTHVLAYNFDSRAECPKWDKFMSEIMPDPEVARVLMEFAGYSIAGGECFAQKALLMVGEGANGKSVFAETITRVVGEKNFSSLMLSNFKSEQMRAILQNKLFNFADESSVYSLKDSSEFKTLVTGGYISAKVVYKQASVFKNKAKLITLTNELPKAYDLSDGFFRRLIVVHFEKQFKGQADNKSLKTELWNELPGICRKMVEAYRNLRDRKYNFNEPQSLIDAVQIYGEENNEVFQFFDEEVEVTQSDQDYMALAELYSKYVSWCNMSGERPRSRTTFTRTAKRINRLAHCKIGELKYDGPLRIRAIQCIRYKGEF